MHATAARNGAFRDLHDVVVEREADENLHLSLHAKLPGSLSVREATRFARQLENELRAELPEVERIEPLEPDVVYGRNVTAQNPDLVRKIQSAVTAHDRVVSCNDVELSSRGGEITAYIDVTVADDLTLEQAHDIETSIEDRVRHVEPSLRRVVVRALG